MNIEIAVCILTLDEEINIRNCINSLNGYLDVHVVDSGSSDATVEIAKSLNSKVYIHKQTGVYSAAIQRNWAMANITSNADWVLFVDADEYLSEDYFINLKTCIDKNNFSDVISVPLIYHFHGKMIKSMGYPNWHDRIVRRNKLFSSAVGEYVDTDNRVSDIKLKLMHHFNSHGMRRFMEKQARYAEFIGVSSFHQLYGDKSEDYFNKPGLKGFLKRFVLKLGILRPFIRFVYQYVFRLGFLEGKSGFLVAGYMGIFEFLVVVAMIEEKRKSENKVL